MSRSALAYNEIVRDFAVEYSDRLKAMRWPLIGVGLICILSLLRFTTSRLSFSLPNHLQDLCTLTFSIIIESLPFVLLGIVLAIIIRLWVPLKVLTGWLPQNGFVRRLYISFLGILLPVCECGNVPLARGLIARGFTPAESLTFLLAAPIINPITLLTTHQAFQTEPHVLIIRAGGALVIANIVGWLFSLHKKPDDLLQDSFKAVCEEEKVAKPEPRQKRSLSLFNHELSSMLPALFVGALIAGLVQVVVPRDVLLGLGGNPVISVFIMLVLAFIVSICSNVDAFFALAFKNTFSIGSLTSFMLFGPMVDIKMLSLMRTTYKPHVLMKVTVLVGLMSLLAGLAVNYAL